MNYVNQPLTLVEAPLWWQEQGLQETATGYGRKLTTRWKTHYMGHLRRVYCVCYSNVGTLYVLVKGVPHYIPDHLAQREQ